MVNCVKEAIWKVRNILIYRKYEISETNVLKIVGSSVKEYMWKEKLIQRNEEVLSAWKVPVNLLKCVE